MQYKVTDFITVLTSCLSQVVRGNDMDGTFSSAAAWLSSAAD